DHADPQSAVARARERDDARRWQTVARAVCLDDSVMHVIESAAECAEPDTAIVVFDDRRDDAVGESIRRSEALRRPVSDATDAAAVRSGPNPAFATRRDGDDRFVRQPFFAR